jgi:TPP-dependent pyruvate/acetoin dehydrogenase alpha subunit
LTLAGIYKPPVVIFIVNNQYAISHPVSKQCASETLHVKGLGYGVPAVRVDGNDVLAVHQASKEAYDRARAGEGPTLVELLTYRVGPHSSSDDPKRYRGDESELWCQESQDPVARLRNYMKQADLWSEAYEQQVLEKAVETVNQETRHSEKEAEPGWETLFDDVYEKIPASLEKQKAHLMLTEAGLEREETGEFPL